MAPDLETITHLVIAFTAWLPEEGFCAPLLASMGGGLSLLVMGSEL